MSAPALAGAAHAFAYCWKVLPMTAHALARSAMPFLCVGMALVRGLIAERRGAK